MKSRGAVIFITALVVFVGIGVWLGGRGQPESGDRMPSPVGAKAPQPAAVPLPSPVVPAPPPPAPPQPLPANPGVSAPAKPAPAPATVNAPPAPPPEPVADHIKTTRAQIDNISLMLRDYRTIVGDNPVGSNAEIVKAVNGGNPRGARLGPPEGMTLNASGELVDSWGTPFFFHQMSATHMDITSAGPDRKFDTADDVKGR